MEGGELIAGLIGALATGLIGISLSIWDRKRRAVSILTAICAEVDSIVRLIEHRQYLDEVANYIDAISKGEWNGEGLVIDIRSNYFSVYESVCHDIGLVNPKHLWSIVNFYAYCKSVIDDTRPDGPYAIVEKSTEHAHRFIQLHSLLDSISNLGNQIRALSPEPIDQAQAPKRQKLNFFRRKPVAPE